jgi:Ca2+-binding EF-hand superfamily protein
MGGKQSKAEMSSESTHLSDPTIDLLVVNTDFTREQIIKIHQEFLRDCPSGLLYKKDFIKMFKQLHSCEKKRSKADKYCEYVFK